MDVSKYFNQTAIYKKYKSTNGKGEKLYYTDEIVKLRLEQNKKRIMNVSGKIQITTGHYMINKVGLNVGDIFIYNNKEYEIIDVEEILDKKAKYVYSEGNLI